MHCSFGSFQPIVCLADHSALATSLNSSYAAGEPTLFELVHLDQRWVGFRAGDLFLSAEPDGRIILARAHFLLWETFRLSDLQSENDGEPKTFCGAPSEPFVQNGEVVRSGGAAARKCTRCSYIFYDPLPAREFLDDYYREVYPAQNRQWYNADTDYSESRQGPVVDAVVSAIHRFRSDFRQGSRAFVAHDVGCSFGGLVMHLRRIGIDASGTELNAAAVSAGRARDNENIFNMTVADYIARTRVTPDLFTAIHVIEHMPDPAEVIDNVRGWVFVSTPIYDRDCLAPGVPT